MFGLSASRNSVAVTPPIGALGRKLLLAALMVAGASSLVPGAAEAKLRPLFDQLLLYNSPATLPTIEVEAEGEKWTRVSTETFHVTTHYYVSLKKGDITRISAMLGFDIAQSRFPGGGKRRWGDFTFQLTGAHVAGPAIAACNNNKASGDHTDGTHTVYVDLGFKLFVGAQRAGNTATQLVDGQVQAKVICKKAPKFVEIGNLAVEVDNSTDTCPKNALVKVGFKTNRDDRIDFTLEHMNAGTATTSEHFAQPFKIGGKFTASQRIDVVVDSNTEYIEVRLKDGSDSKRWRANGAAGTPINCPRAFKVTSLWLSYAVEDKNTCPKKVVEKVTGKATAAGKAPFEIKTQSGLVVHSGVADFKLKGTDYVAEFGRDKLVFSNAFESDMMALIKGQSANSGWVGLKVDCLDAVSGKLTLNRLKATSCQGEALVAIHTNGAGKLPYELECGPGKSWQRKVKAMANKIGVDKVKFDVTNNEQVTCVLRTRIGGKLKPLGSASMTFQCHKPADVGASNDLAPETRPDGQRPDKPSKVVIDPPRKPEGVKPDKPGKVVIDPPRKPEAPKPDKITVSEPKISCANGTVKNGSCACARTHKKVKAGKNAWRCVRAVADPPKNKTGGKKLEVKTAPKKPAMPKRSNLKKANGGKGKAKTAKKQNGLSAVR